MSTADLSTLPVAPTVGSTVTLAASIKNDADVAADPVGLTVTYRKPDGSETTVPRSALTNVGVGSWSYPFTVDQAGPWVALWTGTTPTFEQEQSFQVAASVLGDGSFRGAGPCEPWCTPVTVKDGWGTIPAGLSDTVLERACQAASEACFGLGGKRWPGVCSDTVVPAIVRGADVAGFIMWPAAGGGIGLLPGTVAPDRPSVGQQEWLNSLLIDLGADPIVHVDEIRLSGVVLASTAYKIVDGRWVIRVDGASWPFGAGVWASPPLIEVDYTYGAAPPALGVNAAIALARQLALSLGGDESCSLNRKVKQIIREGTVVDIAVPGLIDSLREGFTGVAEVDLFVEAMNPHHLGRAARVIVPGQTFPTRLG